MHPDLTNFFLDKPDPIGPCLQYLRDLILDFDPSITETIKYGMPCYLYGQKPLCYLWTDKKTNHPYLLIVEGNNINHPSLLQGNRKRMKTLPIDPFQDVDKSLVIGSIN